MIPCWSNNLLYYSGGQWPQYIDSTCTICRLPPRLRRNTINRYLIIIDDIWSTQAWDTIQCAFPENNCSSRIIATTRIVDVARSCCSGGHDRVFHMEALSDIHSRRLFFTRIFGSEDHCPDMLKEVSVEILNKCGGMPLAIISISGFLANIPAVKDDWEKIKRSIGSALEKERSLEGMRNILLLSYNDLPPNLKTCLLYLSVFPEDYVISRKRLVRRWIAEGFISEERGLSRQEVAESYFYELINKSMIQPVYIGDDVVGGGQTIFSRRHGFIRRLSIQHIDQELASALANEDLSHVRSLTVTTPGCIRHLPGLVKFKALRVLDLTYCEGLEEYIMKGMDKLFQLKYFRLEGRGISTLPSGIVTLGNLETLDLRYTSVLELPAKIDQLTKLEHVLAEGDTKIPNGIGNMRNLQVISGFNITLSPTDVVEDLGNLARLDELNVGLDGGGSGEYTRHEEMLLSSLCKLGTSKLRSLHITRRDGSLEFLNYWFSLPFSLQICHMASFYYFTNVPKWIAPTLTNLVDLLICLTDLKEGLHTLGELPALLCVELWWKTTPNDRVTVQGVGFPSLKKFVLRSREGACIAFVKGAMPKLEKLRMPLNVLVARTHDFYLGIEHLPCLKEVSVWIARVGATSSTRKVAADAVRKEVGAHTNHPMVKFVMRSDEHDIEETAHYEEKSKEDNDTAGN